MSGPKNYSGLLDLFIDENPGKTSILLQKTGKIAFTVSFVAGLLTQLAWGKESLILNILVAIFGIGFVVGLFSVIGIGIDSIGRSNGKTTFLSSMFHVLMKVFLYLFLPAILFTAAIFLVATIYIRYSR